MNVDTQSPISALVLDISQRAANRWNVGENKGTVEVRCDRADVGLLQFAALFDETGKGFFYGMGMNFFSLVVCGKGTFGFFE